MDPTDAPKNLILEFLTDLFHKGLEYRTINVYRSALSAYHNQIEGTPVGQLKEVCTLMAGIDNLRPPTPKYSVIWEVDSVLKCIKNWGEEDDKLSNKDLSLKTAMLLALAKIKRCSDLQILDTRYMALGEDKVVFRLAEKPKNFRTKGTIPPPIEYKSIGGSLCPVRTIKSYVVRTTPWREKNKATRFFLSYINPHEPITSSSLGRWLKTVLAKAGVNVSKFTAHSTRSASSAKAKAMGASVSEIMSCGNWKNTSTWETFYNKPIEQGVTSDLILNTKL